MIVEGREKLPLTDGYLCIKNVFHLIPNLQIALIQLDPPCRSIIDRVASFYY